MSIGRSAGPRIMAVGELVSVRDLPPSKKTGELWASEATLRLDDGATVYVKFRAGRQDDDLALYAARVGSHVAMWATANTGQRGDELWFESSVTPSDLDRINSSLLAASKG